jgi:hypothetical protein
MAGGVISVVRLGLFWAGATLYAEHADWRQVAGYALLMCNSVVELGIVSALNGRRPGSMLLVAGLTVLTSAVLGWTWAQTRVGEK